MPELLEIPFSPWSEKARWALELSGVAYTSRVYQPLSGELALRRLLKRFRGPVSVPVLIDGARVIADSVAIARYADEQARAARLFPPAEEARVLHYSALSERALSAGRALALMRVLESRDALLEMVPRPLRRFPAVAVPLAALAIERTLRKYGGRALPPEEHERELTAALDSLRYDLAESPSRGEPRTLLAALSYADVAMAQVLAFVRPPTVGLRIGPASRAAFEHAALAARYPDLLGWRDALYAHYRRPQKH